MAFIHGRGLAGRAEVLSSLDRWFIPAGDCCCGQDARHRLLGEICDEIDAGTPLTEIARTMGLPRAAVEAVAKEWDPERGRPKGAG